MNEKGKSISRLVFRMQLINHIYLNINLLFWRKVGDTINNEINFTGDQLTTENTKSEKSLVVKRTTGSGEGEGKVGSLTVKKVDAEEMKSKLLEGATFTLIDKDSGAIIDTVTTGSDGVVKFEKLLYGSYLLKEDKAPEGYVIGINDTKKLKNYSRITSGNNYK